MFGNSKKKQIRKAYVPNPANDRNIAARAGRWSATHPKTAIVGWFLFVAIALIGGGQVQKNSIPDYEQYTGNSGRAELAIHDHYKEAPASENVLVKGIDGAKYGDPKFDQAVRQISGKLEVTKNVDDVQSPFSRAGPAGYVS